MVGRAPRLPTGITPDVVWIRPFATTSTELDFARIGRSVDQI